jgi:hypothetical protein
MPNTDNMGKLFPDKSGQVVTLFAFPACLLTQSVRQACTGTKYRPRRGGVPGSNPDAASGNAY